MRSATANSIAEALGGHRAGACWMARCPAHDDTTASLAIRDGHDGRVVVHCHAGCSQTKVIDALRRHGLWRSRPDHVRRSSLNVTAGKDSSDRARTAKALKIWCAAKPPRGTVVETYLRSRGIMLAAPLSLRLHPGLRHPSGTVLPAMIGLITTGAGNRPIGIHRTWLAADGTGKAAIERNKMMLGPTRGGAVRLRSPAHPLLVGEGIETCLSAMQATGHAAWAALSTSGMRSLELPQDVRDVIVLADGDPSGAAAAQAAAARWSAEGRSVRIARPPEGQDFNDLLVACSRDEEGCDGG